MLNLNFRRYDWSGFVTWGEGGRSYWRLVFTVWQPCLNPTKPACVRPCPTFGLFLLKSSNISPLILTSGPWNITEPSENWTTDPVWHSSADKSLQEILPKSPKIKKKNPEFFPPGPTPPSSRWRRVNFICNSYITFITKHLNIPPLLEI